MVDTAGEPMRVACVPGLDVDLPPTDRCMRLLLPALEEALATAPSGPGRIGLALGLPPPRPGRDDDLDDRLRQAIDSRFGGRITSVQTFELGHAAALIGFRAAIEALADGPWDAFLVAGVDSYLAPETLEWVEACDQLHGGGPLNNAWGFIPGEAAGALLLLRSGESAAQALAQMVGTGVGHETKLIKTDSVCIGEGLTQAFRDALRSLPAAARIDNVFCDMNGEAYRADEYGFACLRTRERLREATDFVAPADCWGDVGAAGAPLHVLLAIAACRKGYAHGEWSMVWGSSEGGERAAAVVHAPLATRE